jgi:hypothetical protein
MVASAAGGALGSLTKLSLFRLKQAGRLTAAFVDAQLPSGIPSAHLKSHILLGFDS